MQPDAICSVMGNVIHHGPHSDRAYLLKLGGPPDVAAKSLTAIAAAEGYSKAVAKIPEEVLFAFEEQDFEVEARIPGMYNADTNGVFAVRYFDASRRDEPLQDRYEDVLDASRLRVGVPAKPLPEGCSLMPLNRSDISEMVDVFRQVFVEYPFPIHDPVFVDQTMNEGTHYFGVRYGNELVAVSSAEVDADGRNAEMTDFATMPEFRGKGIASSLLTTMEQEMRRMKVSTTYTIARAVSYGMNITFARAGYDFCGRLVNNTCIAKGIESMNIWSKSLTVN